MYQIDRTQEAMAYFELAKAILDYELGGHHERSLTAAQNMKKCSRTVLNIKPEFQQLWTTAVIDPVPKKGKKGKKKKKKKK